MGVLEDFYLQNPMGVIDQNHWDEHTSLVNHEFRTHSVYTPLVSWSPLTATNAQVNWETELIPSDVDAEDIPLTAMYTTSQQTLDIRMRKFDVKRYADKVILNKYSNLFNQWNLNGTHDWRPLLQGVLGQNVVRKFEILSRNVFLRGPKNFWTYSNAAATDFSGIGKDDTFDPSIINAWKLRLGQTGNPIIPGDMARSKLAVVPPGVNYDLTTKIMNAAGLSAGAPGLWRDTATYGDQTPILNFEFGQFGGVRFIEAPSDIFGINPNVMYNCGVISKQWAVTQPINSGDGSPDPASTAIDGIWYTGQKNTQHYIQLEAFGSTDYAVNDWVTIHVKRSNTYGITNGVDPLDTTTITRRVAAVDTVNYRLSFDRPVMRNFTLPFAGQAQSSATPGTYFAYVTKARHIGLVLVLGSREGVEGKSYKDIEFYEPEPVDEFKSVYRFTWDAIMGWNVSNPHMFEVHFCSVSLPTPGGILRI